MSKKRQFCEINFTVFSSCLQLTENLLIWRAQYNTSSETGSTGYWQSDKASCLILLPAILHIWVVMNIKTSKVWLLQCTLRFHTDINQSNTDDSRRKPVFTVMDDLFQISFMSLQVHFHNVQNELKLIAAVRWKHIQKSLECYSDHWLELAPMLVWSFPLVSLIKKVCVWVAFFI